MNLGHIGGTQVLSPLGHPYSYLTVTVTVTWGRFELRATVNSSKQPLAEWDLKLLGDKGTTRSYFSLSDISDKKAQDDKDTKTKKKKQKKEENEDDDESSKKNKDDKKDKKRAKKGKVRVFVGQYLFRSCFSIS